jgi:hypothetical protein
MIKRTLKWLAAGLVSFVLCTVCIPALRVAAQPTVEVDPVQKVAILSATVQIRAYVPLPGSDTEASNMHYKMGQGLGTLVNWQGQAVIVTHNHWGEMLKNAECVGIYDAQGKLLQALGNADFNRLIRYSDPGTLVLLAPEGLSLTVASLGDSQEVVDGEQILVVHQEAEDPDQLDVLPASVSSRNLYHGESVYNLAISAGDKLIPGDSGGGIWYQGKLIGNNWTATTTWLPGLTIETGQAAQLPASYFSILH